MFSAGFRSHIKEAQMKRLFLVACFIVGPAIAEPYAQGSGGCIKSTDQSNSNEIEFGSECGGFLAAELGDTFELDFAKLRVGGELSYRWKNLHGQNGDGKATADGEKLKTTALLVNVTAFRRIYDRVQIYLLGGVGAAYLDGLGDSDWTAAWQTEGGLSWDAQNQLFVSLGYRFFEAPGIELDGNSSDPDFHGVVLGPMALT